MSLVIAVFIPEGIVMSSDSRQSIVIKKKTPEDKEIEVHTVNSDAVMKTFFLEKQRVGISSFGEDLLGGIPISSNIKKFIEEELTGADDVTTIPNKLVRYFSKLFPAADTGFHVGGFIKEGKISIPHVYWCHIAKNIIVRRNIKTDNSINYGASWSGMIDVIDSIVNPVITKDENGNDKVIRATEPIIWDVMALQDAIDFSIYAIQTTIDTMRFQARPKDVGGPIDVLILTPDEVRWIQKKDLHS